MPRRRQPETQLQRAIVQHYRARATPGTFMFAVPNGGLRSPIEAAIQKSTGTIAGIPDTIWIRDGKVYGLEIKTAAGKPTRAQAPIAVSPTASTGRSSVWKPGGC
jgi:hypothetical protein